MVKLEELTRTELIDLLNKKTVSVPYQLCPKCNGFGKLNSIDTTVVFCQCDVCNGYKIIPQHLINK